MSTVITVRVDALTGQQARLTIGELSWNFSRHDAKRIADMLAGAASRGTSGWTVMDLHP